MNHRFTDWLYRYAIKRYTKVFGMTPPRSAATRVSRHALLRYLERVKGVDVQEARNEMWTKELRDRVKEYGGTGKFIVKGVRYTVIDGEVVTCGLPNPDTVNATVAGIGKDGTRKWTF